MATRLFAVRSGIYNGEAGSLTEDGKTRVDRLGRFLTGRVKKPPVICFSLLAGPGSMANRETAQMISQAFDDGNVIEVPYQGPDTEDADAEFLWRIMRTNGRDVVMVTSSERAAAIMEAMGKTLGGVTKFTGPRKLFYAEAFEFDSDTLTCEHLQSPVEALRE